MVSFIKVHASTTIPNMVLFGFNIGNPESAVDVYANKSPNLIPLHIDSKLFQGLDNYTCIKSIIPCFSLQEPINS